MNVGCKIHRSGSLTAVLLVAMALVLAGCSSQPRKPGAPEEPVSGPPAAAHEGRPFDIVKDESLLTVLVYRAGALARAGHNHVVASHDLTGTVYVAEELTRSSFELKFPVASLTIDEPSLRSQEGPDFPPEVPEAARDGTRKNMLSTALLDGERFPEILLQSQGALNAEASGFRARVLVTVRDQMRSFIVPLRLEVKAGEVLASGETTLRQTELGLTPFSAMLGALQVQDEMKIRFRVLARSRQAGRQSRAFAGRNRS